METNKQIAFFCRAKPQGADILDICIENQRCFIGYPLYKNNVKKDPRNLKTCIVDPSNSSDQEWYAQLKHVSRTNEFNKNRNFIRRVSLGSICVIPRPEQGLVYISKIEGPFEICDNKAWYETYMSQRISLHNKNKKIDVTDIVSHSADVSQSWRTGKYKEVSLARVPGWIRKSMFGQSTYGVFSDHPLSHDNRKAFTVLKELYDSSTGKTLKPTTDINEIKSRLTDNLNANSFEHLVVSLLQHKFPEEIWHQTGGPGDGGIDGFGCDDRGQMTGLMQAKYFSNSVPNIDKLGKSRNIRRYAAVLLSDITLQSTERIEVLDLDWVANQLREYRESIPLAITLRIGEA